MACELPPLPYAYNALEPHIDEATLHFHHDRHHATYVANLNKALEAHPDLAALPLEELLGSLDRVPEAIRTAVRNNGGGVLNHNVYWEVLGPNAGGAPRGEIAKAIERDFGGFDKFKEAFSNAALTRFGSGYAWLTLEGGKLVISQSLNQDSPCNERKLPLLTIDVWEHAYYLKYQNRRAEYIAAWWNVVNWAAVAARYQKAMTKDK